MDHDNYFSYDAYHWIWSSSFKKTFPDIYIIITFVIFLTFGILTSMEAPGIPQNLPTPRIGIWERINIGAFMLWVSVFAAVLIQREKTIESNLKLPHVI